MVKSSVTMATMYFSEALEIGWLENIRFGFLQHGTWSFCYFSWSIGCCFFVRLVNMDVSVMIWIGHTLLGGGPGVVGKWLAGWWLSIPSFGVAVLLRI